MVLMFQGYYGMIVKKEKVEFENGLPSILQSFGAKIIRKRKC